MDRLESLVFENKFAAGANLIGKVVQGLTTTNDRVEGEVISVTRNGDSLTLTLDNGIQMPLDNVETIFHLPTPPAPTP